MRRRLIALAGLEHFAKRGSMPRDVSADMAALARPRWPLDEARAVESPIYKTQGRKGAKA